MEKKALIISNSKVVTHSITQFLELFDIKSEAIPIDSEISISQKVKAEKNKDCFIILVPNDYSSIWIKWLYEIRCKAKFRGKCFLISSKNKKELSPTISQTLFEGFISHHQECIQYTQLLTLLRSLTTTEYQLTYHKLRRIQRKIKGIYLAVAH